MKTFIIKLNIMFVWIEIVFYTLTIPLTLLFIDLYKMEIIQKSLLDRIYDLYELLDKNTK